MPRRLPFIVALMFAAAMALPCVAGAQSQERLRIAIPGEDGSLTPYTFESGYAFMSLVYDTLTWRDAAGRPRPWLARSTVRDVGGRTVTVRLRQDVRWHDGEPLTGADVVFTYQYMARHPHPRFTPELVDIERVDQIAPLVVRFTLRRRQLGLEDQPFADIPILPKHIWEKLPSGQRAPRGLPIGSGPYRLTRHVRNRSYRFEANRQYFRRPPSIARIDVPVIRRETSLISELRRRKIDAAPLTLPPGSPAVPATTGFTVSDEISYSGTMLLFNVRRQPFSRLTARQAVAHALDLDVIAANSSGIAGGVVPADRGMVHPQSPWALAGRLHDFDADAARRAFAEQGIGAFRVAAPRNDPVRLEAAVRVVKALRNVGARARLLRLSPEQLDRTLGRRRDAPSFDVAVLGFPALASYDPSYLRVVFGDPSTASLNDGGYRSNEFDSLAERVASARTVLERRDAALRELRFLARDLPAVPLLFGGGAIVYRPAAYDRWIEVRGVGILDKRSFLRGQIAAPTDTSRPTAGATDLTDDSDDQGFTLVPIIIGFVVVVLIGAALWLWRHRR